MFDTPNILRIHEIYEHLSYLYIVYDAVNYIDLKNKAEELNNMDETS